MREQQAKIMSNIFNHDCLLRALRSEQESLAVWGAYQMLSAEQIEIKKYLLSFLESPFADLNEAGIRKIAELGAEEFATHIIKFFRESEGQLKYSAGLALAKFPNDFSRNLLQNWFYELLSGDQATRIELEASTHAFLAIARDKNFPIVIRFLGETQSEGIKSSILLATLLPFCETREELQQALEHFFILRDLYSDPELSFQLTDHLGNSEVTDWISRNISRGYSVSSIYEQCFTLLGIQASVVDRHRWLEIEKSYLTYEGLHNNKIRNAQKLLENLKKWVDSLLEQNLSLPVTGKSGWLLESYCQHHELFTQTIPKILEMESHFLLSLPLLVTLESHFELWMRQPAEHLSQIANYFHSSLLTTEHRERILTLFFPNKINWTEQEVKITQDATDLLENCSNNEILWKFYRKELLGFDLPWPTVFPNPDYSEQLATGLFCIYFYNFTHYVEREDKVAVDYALLLFQLLPQKKVIALIQEHFDYLHQQHTEGLYQTIEYLPDAAFVPHLLKNYQHEEYDVVLLIAQICEIYELEIPQQILQDLESLRKSETGSRGIQKRLRLHCDICNHSFQYFVECIYVDEGAILRMNKLTQDSLWVPREFQCKRCNGKLPFQLSENQLEELTLQSRVDRKLKNLPQSQGTIVGQKILLIDFPRFKNKTYNPQDFEDLVHRYEGNNQANPNDLTLLWIKKAKLCKAMRQWTDCRKVLLKVEAIAEMEIDWVFLLGQANYKLNLFAESRKYFDWIVKVGVTEIGSGPYNSLIEQSAYFIKIMDSEQSKRARFRVIEGKK